MSKRGLNPRQERFAYHYARVGNASGAARLAGYSPKTAGVQGHELLKNPKIQELIEKARKESLKRLEVSLDRINLEVARVAFADLADAFDENGTMLPLAQMPEDVRRAAIGVDVEEKYHWVGHEREHSHDVLKLKLADKLRANELLAKLGGHLKERTELTGKDGGPLIMNTEGLSDERKRQLLGALEAATSQLDVGSVEPAQEPTED